MVTKNFVDFIVFFMIENLYNLMLQACSQRLIFWMKYFFENQFLVICQS